MFPPGRVHEFGAGLIEREHSRIVRLPDLGGTVYTLNETSFGLDKTPLKSVAKKLIVVVPSGIFVNGIDQAPIVVAIVVEALKLFVTAKPGVVVPENVTDLVCS